MTISPTKNTKETLNQIQSSKEKDQLLPIDSETGASTESHGVADGVQGALDRMNATLEKWLPCFLRMTHDRGKQIDHSSNGDFRGFRELDDIGNREVVFDGEFGVDMKGGIESNFGQIESKTFDRMANRNWCSVPTAMDSGDRDLVITIGNVQYPITEEVLHQIFDSFGSFEIIYLCSLENGAVQAQIRFRCSSSAEWARLSRQGRNIYDGCCHMKIEFYKQPQVVENVNRMNTKMEMMIGHFHRMVHDRGQKLDCSFNGGIHELGDIRIREHGGVIENREVRSEFGYQCEGPSMEASYQPLVVKLNINGDSEASRQHTNNKSEILKAKNLANRSPIGDEGMRKSIPFVSDFHGDIGKTEIQFSNFEDHANANAISIVAANVDQLNLGGIDQIVSGFHEVNGLGNSHVHDVFGDEMMEVETNEVLVETEEILVESAEVLVDEELGNARNGMNCDVANTMIGAESGAGCTIVASNINVDIAEEMVMLQGKIKGDVAETELDCSDLDVDAKNLDWKYVNIKHIKIKRINEDFEDPFDVPPNSVQNQKNQLLLAAGIVGYKKELETLLVAGCEVYLLLMKILSNCDTQWVLQWLKEGVG